MRSELILMLFWPQLYTKPVPLASPFPWEWQEDSDYMKYNFYQQKMEDLLDQPYFAKVNNKTEVHLGEIAYLPCRIKDLKEGFRVRAST